MIKLQEKYDIRSYFEQYTTFENKKVLDFGCAYGSFLNFKPQDDYTGIDVRANCIEQNKKKWPQHKWIHCDTFNTMYNPNGEQKLELDSRYDVCVSFSVLTHMRLQDIIDTVDTLKKHCDKLYLSYYSNKDRFAYDTICEFREIPNTQWTDINQNDMFYLEYGRLLWTFFDDEYIAQTLKAKSHTTSFADNDYRGLQRCLVI